MGRRRQPWWTWIQVCAGLTTVISAVLVPAETERRRVDFIASPEMYLAAAAERTRTIKLGTGVVSLPYHHPLMVANRIVLHLNNGGLAP